MTMPRAHTIGARYRWCEDCEHRGYFSRKDAKAVRKRHQRGGGLAVFSCPHHDELFHVGHRPAALSQGVIDRDLLREQAMQSVASEVRL